MLIAASVLWLAVASALWIHYKVTVSDADTGSTSVGAPPQSTFIGALMWPLYLGGFLLDKTRQLLGLKPKE